MKDIERSYQLAKIQHTMSSLRGAIDSIWSVTGYGEDFVGRRELITKIDRLREAVKEIEEEAYEMQHNVLEGK